MLDWHKGLTDEKASGCSKLEEVQYIDYSPILSLNPISKIILSSVFYVFGALLELLSKDEVVHVLQRPD